MYLAYFFAYLIKLFFLFSKNIYYMRFVFKINLITFVFFFSETNQEEGMILITIFECNKLKFHVFLL